MTVDGTLQTWEYQGGTYENISSWMEQVRREELTKIEAKENQLASVIRIGKITPTWEDGIYIRKETGKIGTHTELCASDYIEIQGLSVSIVTSIWGSAGIALYDSSKEFLVGYGNSSSMEEFSIQFGIPANCKYIRVSTMIAQKDLFFMKIDAIDSMQLKSLGENIDAHDALLSAIVGSVSSFELTKGYYIIGNNGNIGTSLDTSITQKIDVSNISMLIMNVTTFYSSGWGIYDKNNVCITSGLYGTDIVRNTKIQIQIPLGASYLIATVCNQYEAEFRIYGMLPRSEQIDFPKYNISRLGNCGIQPIAKSGYSLVLFYGQSLSVGAVSYVSLSDTPLNDCFMLGPGVWSLTGSLSPLIASVSGNAGENPAVAFTNSFRKYLDMYRPNDTKLIASSVGLGSTTIEMLSKECTNNKNQSINDNIYHTRFLAALSSVKNAVGSENITSSVIVFMQGENNYYPGNTQGMTPEASVVTDREGYKSLLLKLKNNMQSDVSSILGQSEKPLFATYQTSGSYIRAFDMPITQAQYEFAKENEDVILLNSHAHVTHESGGNSHLNANGYRWFAENAAKSAVGTLIFGNKYKPVIPEKISVFGRQIKIDCYVPVAPLRFETTIVEQQRNYGFAVKQNGYEINPYMIEISNSTCILLRFKEELTGSIEIAYGTNTTGSKGNICDSDTCRSLTNYVDESKILEDARPYNYPFYSFLYNKPYPLNNWLAHFYKKNRCC